MPVQCIERWACALTRWHKFNLFIVLSQQLLPLAYSDASILWNSEGKQNCDGCEPVPCCSSSKLYESRLLTYFKVFRRCSTHGIWSRNAVFLGSFRWIGTDVRYARSSFSFSNVSIVRWVRATWTGMSIIVPKSWGWLSECFLQFLIVTVLRIVNYRDALFFLSKICLVLQFLDLSSLISEAISLYVFAFLLCFWIPVGIRTSWVDCYRILIWSSWYYTRMLLLILTLSGSLGRSCQIRICSYSSSIWYIGSFSWSRKRGIP